MRPHAGERRIFPDPKSAGPDGVVAFSETVTVEFLVEAYSYGIFPWPQGRGVVPWCCPDPRGVLDFSRLHLSTSFKKFLRRTNWRVTANRDFVAVIDGCAATKRPGQRGTWITPQMRDAYTELHRLGLAHSLECWHDQELIGGLYGVYIAGVFAGESMFFRRANASKLCLWWLIEQLREQGHEWMDTQMVTEGLSAWGGHYISRRAFLARLELARAAVRPLELRDWPGK